MFARSRSVSILMLAALAIAWAAPTRAADVPETEAVMLIATPQFRDPFYGETILIVKPLGDGLHMGFILNKPTNVSLAEVFPGHGPSRSVREPLYIGGPSDLNAVFALVASHSSPGPDALQLAPDLFLAMAGDTVDRVIATESKHARFFAGAVLWRAGELDEELKRGAWYVLDPEPELVLPPTTEGLWRRLVDRAEILENGI